MKSVWLWTKETEVDFIFSVYIPPQMICFRYDNRYIDLNDRLEIIIWSTTMAFLLEIHIKLRNWSAKKRKWKKKWYPTIQLHKFASLNELTHKHPSRLQCLTVELLLMYYILRYMYVYCLFNFTLCLFYYFTSEFKIFLDVWLFVYSALTHSRHAFG